MRQGISFILNAASTVADVSPGMLLVDYLRYDARLTGTKIGCREGDCGACTVLLGELRDGEVVYTNVTSCLVPMGNVAGKHVVTVEGVNGPEPNMIQAAFIEEGASQCGFCTPGFIVSLAGHCLERGDRDATAAISGNICRCTGYKSIERAVARVADHLREEGVDSVSDLVRTGTLPSWFQSIPGRLTELAVDEPAREAAVLVGGGTDLFVQRPAELEDESLRFNADRKELREIRLERGACVLGGSVTVEEVARSTLLNSLFPDIPKFTKLFGSQPIRNMATVAGNIANASPIGDMTILFLALDASINLRIRDARRSLDLREFYRGYKDTALGKNEEIESLEFAGPQPGTFLNFEKVSKRTWLDIASVNTAIRCHVEDGVIVVAHCSAGGVAPVPLYLAQTSAFLTGKPLVAETVREAAVVADGEIAPISDARGSATYKRLLLRQLIYAHFLPHGISWGDLQ